jgi:hypothetical protein
MLLRHQILCAGLMIALASPTGKATAQSPASLILRLLIAAAGENEKPRGTRTEAQDRIAQGYTFNSLPRNAGTRFILASDETALSGVRSAPPSSLPVLFSSDPVARVPELLATVVQTQCNERLALLEYLGTQENRESYRITCGLGSGNESVVASAAPGPAGSYRGPTKIQDLDYVRVRLDHIEITLSGEVLVTLAFQNVTDDDRGFAVAFFDGNSTGIADFWKFFPRAEGALTDNAGNSFAVSNPGVDVFGRHNTDYLIVRSGAEASSTVAFSTRNLKLGSSFSLSLPIWLVTRIKGTTTQQRRTYTIRFTDIRPAL